MNAERELHASAGRVVGWSNERVFVWFIVALISLVALSAPANAIPVFARQYNVPCTVCHEMFPRLNATGEAFRLNGFQWPGSETPNSKKPKDQSGDWSNFSLPSTGVPLAVRFIPTFTKVSGGKGIDTEWEAEIETGGRLSDNLSFFGHFNIQSQLGEAQKTTTTTALYLFLNVERLLATDHLLNLQLGIVGGEDADYFHYRNHNTDQFVPPFQRPFSAQQVIPYPANFSEPDGFRLFRGPGAELWGFTPRMSYAVGYRKGQQNGGGTQMNVGYFQWAYKIGGMDHSGITSESFLDHLGVSSRNFTEGYMENSLSIGVLGDIGDAPVRATPTAEERRDMFWRVGGDMRLKLGSWTGRAGGIVGHNSNPYGTLASGRAKTSTWFVETDYHWVPAFLTEVRYEEATVSIPRTVLLGDTHEARIVPVIAWLLNPNVRFQLSGDIFTHKRTDAKGAPIDHNDITFMADFAF